jgi:hypothetical protein
MKTRHYALIGALWVVVLGCKTDPNVPILERELRRQEDEIYKLQDCVEQDKQALESCHHENAALREKLGLPSSASGRNDSSGTNRPPTPAVTPSTTTPGAVVQPPQIELPAEGTFRTPGSLQSPSAAPPSADSIAPTYKPPATSSKSETAPSFGPEIGPSLPPESTPPKPEIAPKFNMRNDSKVQPAPKVDSAFVEKITLHPLMTGPYDSDGMPWNQGLAALVRTAAPISVVALDPALVGDAARLARWDFSAAQVATMFRATPAAQGVYLQLPWPAGPPKHNRFELYVRFSAADGRKLETHREIALDAPARPQRQWADDAPAVQPSVPLAQTTTKPDGWRQLPGPPRAPAPATNSPSNEETSAAPPAATAGEPELRPATSKKTSAKPAESKVERPVWSPYR